MFDTVIDLNKKTVLNIWLIIAVLTFFVSLTTYSSDKFIIRRSANFITTFGINNLIGEYSTSSLKALLIFLISYWLLNKLMNRKGFSLSNTFKHTNWYYNVAQRKITGLDVLTNVVLYAIIIIAALLGR